MKRKTVSTSSGGNHEGHAASDPQQVDAMAVRTEDDKLLQPVISGLDKTPNRGPGVLNPQYRDHAAVVRYCTEIRDSTKPLWQTLAERAGWTPPNATKDGSH